MKNWKQAKLFRETWEQWTHISSHFVSSPTSSLFFLVAAALGQRQDVLLGACRWVSILLAAWLVPAKWCATPHLPRLSSEGTRVWVFAQILVFMTPGEVSSVCLKHLLKRPIKLKLSNRLKLIAMTNNCCDHKASFFGGSKDRSPASAHSQSFYELIPTLCSSPLLSIDPCLVIPFQLCFQIS